MLQKTPARTPNKKSRVGKAFRSTMMMVRRIHLYSGIFMFPFVLLYGFTGWFFNHPGIFSGDRVTAIAPSDFGTGMVESVPSAETTAAAVVEEMNIESFVMGGPEIKLTSDRSPRYSGMLGFNASSENQIHSITVNPNDGRGDVRTTFVAQDVAPESGPTKVNPIAAIGKVDVAENALTAYRDAVAAALANIGLESSEVATSRRSPSIVFSADAGGVPCVVTYNLGNGAITSMRADDVGEIDGKRFLERLHLARHYTPQWDIRWVWAALVDVMFVSMVFWGCSGLFMWWQVKRTRVLGGAVLVASIVFTGIMAAGMHDNLATSGRTRGGGNGVASSH